MSTISSELLDRIEADFIKAYKAKDMVTKTSLGMLKSEVIAWNKRFPEAPLKDEQVIAIIQGQMKKIDQTVEQAGASADDKTLDALMIERTLYKSYLPEQMSREEIADIVGNYCVDLVWSTQEQSKVVFNSLMRHFNQNFKGRFDNKMLKAILEDILEIKN